MQIHKDKLKTTQKTVDNSEPVSLTARCTSPSKKYVTKSGNLSYWSLVRLTCKSDHYTAARDSIMKENLILARRIFNIMEGTSTITEKINDTKHLDNHPGTMNFKPRLNEAQRIHNRNMVLASRLDTIQPYYKTTDLCVVRAVKAKPSKSKQTKKSRFAKEFEASVNAADRNRADTAPILTGRSEGATTSAGEKFLDGFRFAANNTPSSQQQPRSARKPGESEYSRGGGGSGSGGSGPRSHNVLLEYTKIQDGHCLDVAVLKEPYRDRYAIFGIDVDDGRRYELRLSSDDVSSILDGDILVTSVDNVEVWMALLNKVSLLPVQEFTKLPFTADEVDAVARTGSQPQSTLVASRPSSERPSSRATGGRKNISRGASLTDGHTLTETDAVAKEAGTGTSYSKIVQVETSEILNGYKVLELPLDSSRTTSSRQEPQPAIVTDPTLETKASTNNANSRSSRENKRTSSGGVGAATTSRKEPQPETVTTSATIATSKKEAAPSVSRPKSTTQSQKKVATAPATDGTQASTSAKKNSPRPLGPSAPTTPVTARAPQRSAGKLKQASTPSISNTGSAVAAAGPLSLQAMVNESFVADAVQNAIANVAAAQRR